jgi:hypothetical protein
MPTAAEEKMNRVGSSLSVSMLFPYAGWGFTPVIGRRDGHGLSQITVQGIGPNSHNNIKERLSRPNIPSPLKTQLVLKLPWMETLL